MKIFPNLSSTYPGDSVTTSTISLKSFKANKFFSFKSKMCKYDHPSNPFYGKKQSRILVADVLSSFSFKIKDKLQFIISQCLQVKCPCPAIPKGFAIFFSFFFINLSYKFQLSMSAVHSPVD